MRARAQRLREDLRADPPRTGAREWKNAQRSHALQGKGKGARAGKQGGANAHAAGCGAIPGPSTPSKLPRNGFRCGAFLTGKVSFSGKAQEPFAEEIAP